MRKIGVISDGRTSYGIYKPLIDEIKKNKNLEYKYILTGFHFNKKYGNTEKLIKDEGYKISYKFKLNIDSNKENNQLLILEFYIKKIRDYLSKNKIDIFVGQGDRIITLASAIACAYLKIPYAHMHGGEKSGTFDETIRHVITKLSDIHFSASIKSYKRILKLGELKKNTFLTGSTSAEYIRDIKKQKKAFLFKYYKISAAFKSYCVLLYNPDNRRVNKNKDDLRLIIQVLEKIKMKTILIYPNNDPFSDDIIDEIAKTNKFNFKIIKNLKFDYYICLLKNSKFLIGNSSGGIIETPSLGIPNILVGSRQVGREIAFNTIVTKINKNSIKDGINKALNDKKYLQRCKLLNSPYLPNKNIFPSKKITKILHRINLDQIKDKQITF